MCLLVPEEFEMVGFMWLFRQHFEGTFLGFQKLTLGNDGCQGDSIFGTCPQKDFPVCHNEKNFIKYSPVLRGFYCNWKIFFILWKPSEILRKNFANQNLNYDLFGIWKPKFESKQIHLSANIKHLERKFNILAQLSNYGIRNVRHRLFC